MIEVKEILRLWLAAVPKQRISRMLGVDRKTVRRYIELAAEHGFAPGAEGTDALTDERLESILVASYIDARPASEGTAAVQHQKRNRARLLGCQFSRA